MHKKRLVVMAGPCVIQNQKIAYEIADNCKRVCEKYNIEYIFKASYKKANRTKQSSFTTVGVEKALKIIKNVGDKFGVLTMTDIHESSEVLIASKYVDIAQIPAFLCRQTDLINAVSQKFKTVNIKKGQWMSHQNMLYAKEKTEGQKSICDRVFLTERGNIFGYNQLVVDFPRIDKMKSNGAELIVDCTHSTQVVNNVEGVSGGNSNFIECLAKCAIVSNADGVFIETHPNPLSSPSDALSMLPLSKFEKLIQKINLIYLANQ